mgnify:FL=1
MDPKRKIEEKIVTEKLAVFTFDDEINEPSFRRYLIENWNNLTVGMKKSTILFMGGIHGKETGKFGAPVGIQTLKNQVRIFFILFFVEISSKKLLLIIVQKLCWKGWVLLELASECSSLRAKRASERCISKNETTKVELRSTRSSYAFRPWIQSEARQKVARRKCPPNLPRPVSALLKRKKPSTRSLTGLRSSWPNLTYPNFLPRFTLDSRSESVARTCHELFEEEIWRNWNFCGERAILERALHCCTTASWSATTEKTGEGRKPERRNFEGSYLWCLWRDFRFLNAVGQLWMRRVGWSGFQGSLRSPWKARFARFARFLKQISRLVDLVKVLKNQVRIFFFNFLLRYLQKNPFNYSSSQKFWRLIGC